MAYVSGSTVVPPPSGSREDAGRWRGARSAARSCSWVLWVALGACAPRASQPPPLAVAEPTGASAPSPVANAAPEQGGADLYHTGPLAGGTGDCGLAPTTAAVAMRHTDGAVDPRYRLYAAAQGEAAGAFSAAPILAQLGKASAPLGAIAAPFTIANSAAGIINSIMLWTGNGPEKKVLERLDEVNAHIDRVDEHVQRLEDEMDRGFDDMKRAFDAVAEAQWATRRTQFADSWAGLLASFERDVRPKQEQLDELYGKLQSGQVASDADLAALAREIKRDVGPWSDGAWTHVLADEFGPTSYSVDSYGQIVAHRLELKYGGAWSFGDLPYYNAMYAYVTKLLDMQIEAARLRVAAHTYLGQAKEAEAAASQLATNGRLLLAQAGWPLDACNDQGQVIGLVNRAGKQRSFEPGPVDVWVAAPGRPALAWVLPTWPEYFFDRPSANQPNLDGAIDPKNPPHDYDVELGLPAGWESVPDKALIAAVQSAPKDFAGGATAWLTAQGFTGLDPAATKAVARVHDGKLAAHLLGIGRQGTVCNPSETHYCIGLQADAVSFATGEIEAVRLANRCGCNYQVTMNRWTDWWIVESGAKPQWTAFPLLATVPAVANKNTGVLRPATDDYIVRHGGAFGAPPARPAMPQLQQASEISPASVGADGFERVNITLHWTAGTTPAGGKAPDGYEVFNLAEAGSDGLPVSVASAAGTATSVVVADQRIRPTVMLQVQAFWNDPTVGAPGHVYSWPVIKPVKLGRFIAVPDGQDLYVEVGNGDDGNVSVEVMFDEPAGNLVDRSRSYQVAELDEASGNFTNRAYWKATDAEHVLDDGRATSGTFAVKRGGPKRLRLSGQGSTLAGGHEQLVRGGMVEFTIDTDSVR